MPTLELNEDFESGSLAGYSSPGAAAVDATAALQGALGLHTVGAGAQDIGYSPPAGQTLSVGRFTFKVPAGGSPVGGVGVLHQVHTASGKNLQIRINTSGVLQAIVTAGVAQNGPSVVEGQEYTIDFRADCSGATYTLDWQVDGVAQTQATSAQAASTISTSSGEKLGNTTIGVTAMECYFDSWAISRDTADYPIGAPVVTPPATQTITVGQIASTTTLHGPTVAATGAVAIAAAEIASTVAIHAATIAAAGAAPINPGRITGAGSIHGPTLTAAAAVLAVSRIPSATALHAPQLAAAGHVTLAVTRISSGSHPYKPTVAGSGAAEISAGSIPSGATLHGPAVTPGAVTFTVPQIAGESATYAPSIVLVSNSLEVDEEFDGGFTDWLVTGSPVLDTDTPIQSGASAHFAGTGFQWLKHVAPAGHTVDVFRFLYRHDSVPTGAAANLYTADSSSGKNATIRVTPAGVIQACVTGGGLNANGPTLVLGQTYLIDGRFDVSASTFTIDWQLDGADQPQAFYDAGAAGTITQDRAGNAAPGSTFDFTLDSVAVSRVHDAYPLGQPPAAPLQIFPGSIPSAATVYGSSPLTNAGTLVIRVPRIVNTPSPKRPAVAQVTPPPPPSAYSGPRGVMVRTTSEDITSTWNTRPWADVVRAWKTWSSLELSHGNFTWGGIVNSLKYCIDNGKQMWLTIQMGRETPAWAYLANPTGALEKLTVYTGPTDSTGYNIPLPWDANLPLHYQRIIDHLATLLATPYNGKTYGDAIGSITFGYSVTGEVGHEMSIGDNGDARNTALWNTYGTVAQRQQWVTNAWIDALDRFFATLPDYRPNIGCGTVWSDKRQCSMDVALYAATTYPDKAANVLMGPTDMRVDKPGAVSYRAWSASAADALLYYASVGVTPWCQSAGDSWFGSGSFDIPTPDAVKKSYLDNGCDIYRCVIVETNTQILSKYALDSWAQNTLSPAVRALALPLVLRAGHIASAAVVHGPRATGVTPPYLFTKRLESTVQLRGGMLSLATASSPDYVVPCYNDGVIVSSDDTPIISDVGTFVYEVEL